MLDTIAPESARILLVNDRSDARALIRRTLSRLGIESITEVADGRVAVQHLRAHPIDLLITDIHMPHLDGWRLARMIRSGVFKCPSNIPIIVVSATFSGPVAEVTAREFGVTHFLALKDRKELVAAVVHCLSEQTAWPASLLVIEDDPDAAR